MKSEFTNDPNVKAAFQFAKALESYPEEVGMAVGTIIENFVNGCSWAFIPDSNREYLTYSEMVEKNPEMTSVKVRGGYLLTMNMDYLIQVLRRTAGNYVTPKDLELASAHRQEALVKLDKYMKNKNQGVIGIYCLNDSPSITIDGIRYPALCVTLNDLLALCVRNGYYLKLGGHRRTPKEVAAHSREVISRLSLPPSRNALMIELCK